MSSNITGLFQSKKERKKKIARRTSQDTNVRLGWPPQERCFIWFIREPGGFCVPLKRVFLLFLRRIIGPRGPPLYL